MVPLFLDQVSSFSIAERDQDQDQVPLPLFPESNGNSSFSYIFSCNGQNSSPAAVRTEDHRRIHHQLEHQQIESAEIMIKGLPARQALRFQTDDKKGVDSSNAQALISRDDQHRMVDEPFGSVKWMSSKMRFMRKMMGSSEQANVIKQRSRCTQPRRDYQPNQESSGSSIANTSQGIIRVCSDCNTTKTPLWRSGPQGPKSLCNACGIRQRKARRAMAAAAAVGAGLLPFETPGMTSKVQNDKRSVAEDRMLPFKKRCKIVGGGSSQKKKHRLDEFTVRLSKSSAFHQVFPQDERDAAILLMTLSCGLINS